MSQDDLNREERRIARYTKEGRELEAEHRDAERLAAQFAAAAENPALDERSPSVPHADLVASFRRLGISMKKHGPRMSRKLGELGEQHPLTQAILSGSDKERDAALRQVHGLIGSPR